MLLEISLERWDVYGRIIALPSSIRIPFSKIQTSLRTSRRYFSPSLAAMRPRTLWETFRFPGFIRRESVNAIFASWRLLDVHQRLPPGFGLANSGPVSTDPTPMPRAYRSYIWLQRKVMQLSMRKAAQNVFLTQNTADLTSHWWSLDGLPHCVIHNGLDPEHLPKTALPEIDERDHFALAVGNFYLHKNYGTVLIEAMEYYKEHFDDGLRLVILGGPMPPSRTLRRAPTG